jgi:beta-fructofuranosidase
MATIRQGMAQRYGVRVLCDQSNENGMDVVVEPENKFIRVGSTAAPLELKAGEDIQLRIFIDRGVVEVFANERQALVKHHVYAPEAVGVCFFSEGGRMEVMEVKSWKMQPANREAE